MYIVDEGAIEIELAQYVNEMSAADQQLELKLSQLQEVVKAFTAFFEQNLDFQLLIYPLWNAKDILGHITFWHESFARNIADLANGKVPSPLKGKLSEMNVQSTASTRAVPIAELIGRLQRAQHTIESHIHNSNITLIPYKKGSRDYSRLEHIEVVTGHIQKHLNDLKKRYDQTKH